MGKLNNTHGPEDTGAPGPRPPAKTGFIVPWRKTIMTQREIFQAATLAALLMTGSCASFTNGPTIAADPRANHPIVVEPGMRALKVVFASPAGGLRTDDALRLDGFVRDYLQSGNGKISILAPRSGDAEGLSASSASAWPRPASRRRRFSSAPAKAPATDRWNSASSATAPAPTPAETGRATPPTTASNLPLSDFGCATQHNLAAMVADPRDLVEPRGMGEIDATRRTTVVGKYERGEITSAQKTQEQSAAVSEVDKN